MPENVAGALCYAVIWITGIIFLLIDRRPHVRFHAAQSIVVFGGLHVLHLVLTAMLGPGLILGGGRYFSAGTLLVGAVELLGVAFWIVCMVLAAQGRRFEVPVAATIAHSITGQ